MAPQIPFITLARPRRFVCSACGSRDVHPIGRRIGPTSVDATFGRAGMDAKGSLCGNSSAKILNYMSAGWDIRAGLVPLQVHFVASPNRQIETANSFKAVAYNPLEDHCLVFSPVCSSPISQQVPR